MFSFIVVNHNTAQLASACLRSIFTQLAGNDFEVIVVDNASSDASVKLLTEEFGKQIKLIRSKTNGGFARANNLGSRLAQGEYLFFLNSDTLITRDILKNLKVVLDSEPTLGIVAPQLLAASGKRQLFSYGYFPNLSNLILGKLFAPITPPIVRNLQTVDWVSGAALIIRSEVWQAVGAWDEKYFMYFEDVDLCWRVKKAGYSVAVLNTVKLIHLGGRSWQYNYAKKKRYYQSQTYFFKKNYGNFQAFILRIIRSPYKIWIWLNN